MLTIRPEMPSDRDAIRAVVKNAFAASEHGYNGESELVERLRADGDIVVSLVAEKGDEIVGHVLFSRLQEPSKCIALAPVAVFPLHQRTGVGSALIKQGLALLENGDWLAAFVLGSPEYYKRFGFSVEAAAKFETEYPKDFFMACELSLGGLSACTGSVVAFAKAFELIA